MDFKKIALIKKAVKAKYPNSDKELCDVVGFRIYEYFFIKGERQPYKRDFILGVLEQIKTESPAKIRFRNLNNFDPNGYGSKIVD